MSEEEADSMAGCGVCLKNKCDADGLVGCNKYPYGYLCWPTMPWSKGGVAPPAFFGKDEVLPLVLSLFLGLQHAIAMLAGIATSGGYLITNDTCLTFQHHDLEFCSYKSWLISCAWITSGLLTAVQVFRVKLAGSNYYLGTGLISVMGTSFTFLPIVRGMVMSEVAEAAATWPTCAVNGTTVFYTGDCCAPGFWKNCQGAGSIGYGKFLGTAMVAALSEVILSFVPPRILRMLFPPVVTGTAVMLIGGGLISSGMLYVGGGVFCGQHQQSRAAAGVSYYLGEGAPGTAGYGNRFLRDGGGSGPWGTVGPQLCFNDNGGIALSFGSPEYVGLAMSVVFFSILCQMFGSPFIKSTYLIWGLAFGCLVATCGKDMDGDGEIGGTEAQDIAESYYRRDYLDPPGGLDPLTFLWAKATFPIGFSAAKFPVILIGFMISSAETIGDIAMTCKFSDVTDEDEVSSRIQGGLLADGVNSFFATLFGSPPNTTFSQNNGLISLTRCASRSAGFSCAFWLVCLGVISGFGAAFASIPICVMGGVLIQTWASVFVSGMTLATTGFTRRNGFILTVALGIGLGVAMEGQIIDQPGPYTFFDKALSYDYGFWPTKMVCKTPYTFAPLMMSPAGPALVPPFGGRPSGMSVSSTQMTYNGNVYNITGNHDKCTYYNGSPENGSCCAEWDDGAKAWRDMWVTIMKTPYGVGFLIAFILNLIIPEDKDDAETPVTSTASKSEA